MTESMTNDEIRRGDAFGFLASDISLFVIRISSFFCDPALQPRSRLTMLTDLRSAFRHLFKSPGFAAWRSPRSPSQSGLNTAIFTVVHALLLDPFPYPNANRLGSCGNRSPTLSGAADELHGT